MEEVTLLVGGVTLLKEEVSAQLEETLLLVGVTLQMEEVSARPEEEVALMEGVIRLLEKMPRPLGEAAASQEEEVWQTTTGLLGGAAVMSAENASAVPNRHGPRPPMRHLSRRD